jgi:enoyl-CoA hydratase/carnithine racemase
VRAFLERVHAVLNVIDAAPFVTIAAVHGACFGGGLELALACDMIIADKMARFAFPELRLGFIPGFGGIPRLKRDLGNAFVRDLLFTGRTVNATRAQSVGLVAQLAGEGEALRIARSTATQITKYDAVTREAAKKFIKPIPHDEFRREIDLFCELFTRPAVMAALKKFVESSGPMPYLP